MERIVIVDDDEDFCEWLRMGFEQSGYEVVVTGDAPAAELLLKTFVPDAVVIDIRLPGMDGVSFCRLLRNNPRTAGIGVILVSGVCKSEEDRSNALQAGADDFLVKPFSYAEIRLRLQRLLQSPLRCRP